MEGSFLGSELQTASVYVTFEDKRGAIVTVVVDVDIASEVARRLRAALRARES